MSSLTLTDLTKFTTQAAAIRVITELEPAGGPGDKIFPPTYVKDGRATTKYAFEDRVIDGRTVKTVLLDSVASQANRFEEALLEAHRRGELVFPLVEVDFTGDPELVDLDRISALQAPHRIADALLRDSVLGSTPFRQTDIGKAFTDARPNHATGMFKYCPHALIFGVWDSTGPKGGLGSKFARVLVSEIIGLDATPGVKTASRIDPAQIEKVPLYASKADPNEWTAMAADARQKGGKPEPFAQGTGKDKDKPSAVNHGNIAPTIENDSGGVTVSGARQTIVLSLGGLRRLRFLVRSDGQTLELAQRAKAETAAHTVLAALALAAVVHQRDNDFDLRSRSVLVAKGPLVFEVLGRDGSPPQTFDLDREGANKLVAEAASAAEKLGLGWDTVTTTLTPAPKLAALIKASRAAAAAGLSVENT